LAKHLTKTAKLPHNWEYVHDKVGYNYRMPNINAALGCAQLEKLQHLIESKKQLYKCYEDAFKNIPKVQLFQEPKRCSSNYWLQTLLLEGSVEDQMESVLEHTNSDGLMTRPVWKNLHSLIPFRNCPRAPLPVAESLEKRLINLPSSSGLI
jgi:perosamine synthetase